MNISYTTCEIRRKQNFHENVKIHIEGIQKTTHESKVLTLLLQSRNNRYPVNERHDKIHTV